MMSRGSELIREQLIRKAEEHLTEGIKAARTADLSDEELRHIFDILLEVKTDD